MSVLACYEHTLVLIPKTKQRNPVQDVLFKKSCSTILVVFIFFNFLKLWLLQQQYNIIVFKTFVDKIKEVRMRVFGRVANYPVLA